MSKADDGERYTIDGLIALHELHPELREIIVEGRVDAGIVSWFLKGVGVDCDVFDVDDRVTVTRDDVNRVGLTPCSRARVIALASSFESALPEAQNAIMCIADADFDYLTGKAYGFAVLERTDLASLELHALSSEALIRFQNLFLHPPEEMDLGGLVEALIPTLVDLFLVRYLIENCSPPPGMVEKVGNYVLRKRSVFSVDVEKILLACLAGRRGNREEARQLAARVESLRASIGDRDHLKFVHWHDAVKVLISALGLKNDLAKPEVIERALVASLDRGDLDEAPLFKKILEKFQAAA